MEQQLEPAVDDAVLRAHLRSIVLGTNGHEARVAEDHHAEAPDSHDEQQQKADPEGDLPDRDVLNPVILVVPQVGPELRVAADLEDEESHEAEEE